MPDSFILRAADRGHGRYLSTGPNASYIAGHPDAVLTRPTLMAVFDHVRDTLTLCAPVWPGGEPGAALEAAEARLDEAEAALALPVPRPAPPAVLSLRGS